ncbi:MAG: hypothetical protein ACSLE6_03625, partial [Mycobacterium sp.]
PGAPPAPDDASSAAAGAPPAYADTPVGTAEGPVGRTLPTAVPADSAAGQSAAEVGDPKPGRGPDELRQPRDQTPPEVPDEPVPEPPGAPPAPDDASSAAAGAPPAYADTPVGTAEGPVGRTLPAAVPADSAAGQSAAEVGDPKPGRGADELRQPVQNPTPDVPNDPPAPAGVPPALAGAPPPAPPRRRVQPAYILGGGVIPASQIAELIRQGATVRWLKPTADLLAGEPRYRPSQALTDWVRMRDVTCRFPQCDVPADRCDLDHSTPWPDGSTHPSSLNCKCRRHHLLKTFGGWKDQQLPDGTLIWTSPAGKTYTTKPGLQLLYPTTNLDTGPAPPPPPDARKQPSRRLTMPKRARPRTEDWAIRTATERAHNRKRRTETGHDPPF